MTAAAIKFQVLFYKNNVNINKISNKVDDLVFGMTQFPRNKWAYVHGGLHGHTCVQERSGLSYPCIMILKVFFLALVHIKKIYFC